MPSVRQKRVAKLVIENTKLDEPLTGGEIVESSGYGASMKKNPQVVLNSDGVQEELQAQGFTEDNAKEVVQSIMLNEKVEPNARLKASDMVFKVHGSYAPDKNININMNVKSINPTDKEMKELRDKYEEELRNKLNAQPK